MNKIIFYLFYEYTVTGLKIMAKEIRSVRKGFRWIAVGIRSGRVERGPCTFSGATTYVSVPRYLCLQRKVLIRQAF